MVALRHVVVALPLNLPIYRHSMTEKPARPVARMSAIGCVLAILIVAIVLLLMRYYR
jgi:hypothetical protein